MKRLLIVLSFVTICGISVFAQNSDWSETMYEDYTYETFENFGPANEQIDFAAIDYPLLNAAVFYETNRRRVENNRDQFTHSSALEKSADGHSKDMVQFNFFSHTSTVAGKRSMADRMAAEGVTNGYRGENIAYTFGLAYEGGRGVYTPEHNDGYFSYEYQGDPIPPHTYLSLAVAVLDSWMNSTGHRQNILNREYTYLGAGSAYYEDDNFFDMPNFKFTQNFSSEDK